MPLVFTLASRNLFQDKIRLIAAVTGIVFSVVLVLLQVGLYYGFERTVTLVVDHTPTDFWVVSSGTKYFEDISILDIKTREKLMALEGVAEAVPVVASFSAWIRPDGEMNSIFVIASDPVLGGVAPWNINAGKVDDLAAPGTVAIDTFYAHQLGVNGLGDGAEIRGHPVTVGLLTTGIRSFTTTPYVFTDFQGARSYIGLPANLVTHFLVRTKAGTDLESVRSLIHSHISAVQVLTPSEFRARTQSFWLYRTGAGGALVAAALLAVIVGTVIIIQTLYSSTKEHLYEFAMLRAIGASNWYIYETISFQALVTAMIGLTSATLIGIVVSRLTESSIIQIVITPDLLMIAFVLTLFMSIASAMASIVRVLRVDPASVVTR